MISAVLTKEKHELILPLLTEDIDDLAEFYEKNSLPLRNWLPGTIGDYQQYLAYECYINPGKETTYYIMRRLQQLSLGWLQCPLYNGELFDFELDETLHAVYGDSDGEAADAVKWFRALQTAWVTRNQKAIDFLMGMDFRVVRSVTPYDDSVFTSIAALYRKLHLQQDIRNALLEAQYSPTTLSRLGTWADTVELIYLPIIDVIATIAFEEGEVRFNQAIENALHKHQKKYSKDPDIATPDTALSLPLMGLAALAYDRLGYRVTVENRYIPQWLVEHQDWSQLPPLADDSLRLNFPVRTRNPLEK
ncbi:hypothetical protein GCM10011297_23180 [Bacterioplanes sanyensis]|uniref:immunity 49 family protein n=1 Tax=Bacterioplanes sanyensis TaxID=1249553 RepID=UPI00167430EB|nr:immunity 49 family protein [Bacterioplanes sanyensis]GGY49582.1 hypothetical protein GCM10011297_23180 [Bacterioplanes sanyensis]